MAKKAKSKKGNGGLAKAEGVFKKTGENFKKAKKSGLKGRDFVESLESIR